MDGFRLVGQAVVYGSSLMLVKGVVDHLRKMRGLRQWRVVDMYLGNIALGLPYEVKEIIDHEVVTMFFGKVNKYTIKTTCWSLGDALVDIYTNDTLEVGTSIQTKYSRKGTMFGKINGNVK